VDHGGDVNPQTKTTWSNFSTKNIPTKYSQEGMNWNNSKRIDRSRYDGSIPNHDSFDNYPTDDQKYWTGSKEINTRNSQPSEPTSFHEEGKIITSYNQNNSFQPKKNQNVKFSF
jgi:hypothetical protein